jgi:hypothetical protein
VTGIRAVALGLALLVASAPARASDSSTGELVRVEYAAPEGCPDRQAFETELTAHLGADTFARFGELARTLSVTVELAASDFRARVELIDRRGSSVEREISAPTCEQAVRAIALVAALAARSQVEQMELERKSATPTRSDPPEPAPAKASTASVEPAPQAPLPVESARPVARTGRAVIVGLSAGTAAATGVGPGVAPGVLVAFRTALGGTTERSLVLSAMGYDTFRSSLAVADVRFSVLKARIELCPVEPHLSEHLLLSPCAGFELGSQTGRSYADGLRVGTPRSESQLWAAATLAARASFGVGAFTVALGPELGMPVVRNGYALTRPDRSVYRVPSVTLGFAAAAGLVWN